MGKIVKKTIELNQDYIDRARVIFGVKTENAAVNEALEFEYVRFERALRIYRAGTSHRPCGVLHEV